MFAQIPTLTSLDIICICFLGLLALGGYYQGFVRGCLRLFALGAGAIAGFLFMQRVGYLPEARTTAMWAAAAALLGLSIAILLSWSISMAVPPWLHHHVVNRILGIFPAIIVGLLILTLGLGLADRLVDQPSQQAFLRSGSLTGILVQFVDIGQGWLTGVY